MKILDVGTGAGHFPCVARYFGQSVLATELPEHTSQTQAMYSALCRVFGVTRVTHEVKAQEHWPDFGARFDLVTGFLVNFNIKLSGEQWQPEDWGFFLRSLKDRVLAPSGKVYLQLTDPLLNSASWSYLQGLADWSVDRSKQIVIGSQLDDRL